MNGVRRVLGRCVQAIHLLGLAVVLIVCSPIILFQFGVDAVCHRIKTRWPDSMRAGAVSFWIGLLTPVLLIVVFLVAIMARCPAEGN